jgi:hypothetical protein
MEVVISAPNQDQGTAHIAEAIRAPLRRLSEALSGQNFGGNIEHLWIELELVPGDADHRQPWNFRFQKRVAPRPIVSGLGKAEYHNVGHYSVRPDYFALAKIAPENVNRYLIDLIYESTAVLEKKRRQLGAFDAAAFRSSFLQAMAAERDA